MLDHTILPEFKPLLNVRPKIRIWRDKTSKMNKLENKGKKMVFFPDKLKRGDAWSQKS
jgi:hypothetical protein